MKFGPVPIDQAQGAILAHGLRVPGLVLKKGARLTAEDCRALSEAGVTEVTIAALEPGDVDEDTGACRIGARLRADGFRVTEAFTGRINLIAERAGLLRVHADRIHRINGIDEALTIATLPDLARVDPEQLAATVKIIPYGLADRIVAEGETLLDTPPITLLPFRGGSARLILTRTPGFKDSLIDKGAQVVSDRMEALGYTMAEPVIVPHETDAVARALTAPADLTLILGASATSDRADVAPAALVQAGGRIARFGMPVDPGNLLFLGTLNGAPVVGLPGCARSPALNGVDWVLERLAAGLDVTRADIAAMGVGGLLKEMPGRPQPRRSPKG